MAEALEPADDPEVRDIALLRRRLRWKLRGNWAGLTFVAAVAADAALLAELPFAGSGIDVAGAVLLAGFFNLAVVAVLAPAAAVLVRRRRADLPAFVARDRAGTALMLGLVGVLVAGGLAHRPAVREAEADAAAQAAAVRRWLAAEAPQLLGHVASADTTQVGEDLYRSCVPTGEPQRAVCLYVSTDQSPPGVTRDSDGRANSVVFGPENPGRSGP